MIHIACEFVPPQWHYMTGKNVISYPIIWHKVLPLCLWVRLQDSSDGKPLCQAYEETKNSEGEGIWNKPDNLCDDKKIMAKIVPE